MVLLDIKMTELPDKKATEADDSGVVDDIEKS